MSLLLAAPTPFLTDTHIVIENLQFVEAYYARDIERGLGLGKDQLVALAMLLGGDYTDGVRGVGIVNGMEVLRA